IAYEMLTGQRPFQGNSWATMIHSIMSTEPLPIHKYREDLGEAASAVLRKALAKDPAARFSTCREFSDAMEHAILGSTGERTSSAERTLLLGDRAETQVHETLLMAPQTTSIIATR